MNTRDLSTNQLKMIALVTMVIDHTGLLIFPEQVFLRCIGRIAFPIFAYFIAEGAHHTRHPKRYLGEMLTIGILCQVGYFVAEHSLYLCILITFSLSLINIFSIKYTEKYGGPARVVIPLFVMAATYYFSMVVTSWYPMWDFAVDYGFVGIMVPVIVYLGKTRSERFFLLFAALTALNISIGWIEWWSYLALIPLFFYKGRRGKVRMKQFFYIFYPTHLVILNALSMVLQP